MTSDCMDEDLKIYVVTHKDYPIVKDDLHLPFGDKVFKQAAEHVARLCIEPNEWAVYDHHAGTYSQRTGQLVLAHFAAGECHKLLVPDKRYVKQRKQTLLPYRILDIGECIPYNR